MCWTGLPIKAVLPRSRDRWNPERISIPLKSDGFYDYWHLKGACPQWAKIKTNNYSFFDFPAVGIIPVKAGIRYPVVNSRARFTRLE